MTPLRNIISTIPKTLSTTTVKTTNTTSHFRRHISKKPSELPSWVPAGVKEEPRVWMPNGSMKRGPKSCCNYWGSVEKGVMPGVPKKNVKVSVVGCRIVYEGFEDEFVKGFPDEHTLRAYKGEFGVNPHLFDASKVKAEIFNGILWLHVPKLN